LTSLPPITSLDDVTQASNVSSVGEPRSDDVTMTLIVGVTLGPVALMAVLLVTCVTWLVYRRRRRDHAQSPPASCGGLHENTRLDPETADNRLNDSSARRNNAASSPGGRYTSDGALVLTVNNDCRRHAANDVVQCAAAAAADVKKDNYDAAAATSPAKSASVGGAAVSNDVSKYVTDDVNVWPYGADEVRSLCGGERADVGADFRRASAAAGVCDDDGKYRRSKNPPTTTKNNDECRSARDRTHR